MIQSLRESVEYEVIPVEAAREMNEPGTFHQLTAVEVEDFLVDIGDGYGELWSEYSRDGQGGTFLQFSCHQKLAQTVEGILRKNVNPNVTSNGDNVPPLIIAARNGDVKTLTALASVKNIDLNITVDGSAETALHLITQRLWISNDYCQCLELLCDNASPEKRLDFNARDTFRNTPLFYAAQTGVEKSVIALLRGGSLLCQKNLTGKMPISKIRPATLRAFFDTQIECKLQDRFTNDFEIKFDNRVFSPPGQRGANSMMSTSVETANDTASYKATLLDSDVLYCIQKSARLHSLLTHPLVSTFLMRKWHLIKKYFYCNFAFHLLFVASLIFFSLMIDSVVSYTTKTAVYSLVLMNMLLAVCILLPCFPLRARRFRNKENWMEIVMLGLAISAMILYWCNDATLCRQLCAVAVLLAWMKVFLLFGRLPCFSTQIAMFITISRNILMLLVAYLSLLVGFAFSFYLLFNPEKPNATREDRNATECRNETFSGWNFLLKTASMMTGEFGYDDLCFDFNPYWSHFTFLTFIFLVVIVLMSAVNGIAVSDIQAIRDEAEIIGLLKRMESISYIESILLGVMKLVNLGRSSWYWVPEKFTCKPNGTSNQFQLPDDVLENVYKIAKLRQTAPSESN